MSRVDFYYDGELTIKDADAVAVLYENNPNSSTIAWFLDGLNTMQVGSLDFNRDGSVYSAWGFDFDRWTFEDGKIVFTNGNDVFDSGCISDGSLLLECSVMGYAYATSTAGENFWLDYDGELHECKLVYQYIKK